MNLIEVNNNIILPLLILLCILFLSIPVRMILETRRIKKDANHRKDAEVGK